MQKLQALKQTVICYVDRLYMVCLRLLATPPLSCKKQIYARLFECVSTVLDAPYLHEVLSCKYGNAKGLESRSEGRA